MNDGFVTLADDARRAAVVEVPVRDEHVVDQARCYARVIESFVELTRGETGVNEEAELTSPNECGVAFAA